MSNRLNIIFCVEKGILEQQALLLVRSALAWLGDVNHVFHAYTPRKGHWPTKETIDQLLNLGVHWCNEPLNTVFYDYPIANKVLACQHFEQTNPGQTCIKFVDTDTIFVNRIDQCFLDGTNRLYLRPVDNKGPGSESCDDPNDLFWQGVFAMRKVKLPPAQVETTVRPSVIRNYFNAGLIWTQGMDGFFQQWYEDFIAIVDSDLRPFGYQSRDGDDFRCLDQVALAVTATRYAQQLKVLPETYNYPIPFRPMMRLRTGHPEFSELVHIHYHKWLQHPGFLAHVATSTDQASKQYQWLSAQPPLAPIINDSFKC